MKKVGIILSLLLFTFAYEGKFNENPQNQEQPYIVQTQSAPDRILVKFKKQSHAPNQEQVQANIEAAYGLNKQKHFKFIDVVLYKTTKNKDVVIRALNKNPNIEYAEPDYIVSHCQTYPNDPYGGNLWGLNNIGQTGGTVNADIDAPEAWDYSTGSSSIIVAVIDSGVDYSHPDLTANMWMNPGEVPGNSIDDDGNGYVDDVFGINAILGTGDPWDDPFDDGGHGTHCAGTIAAVGNNSVGVVGVCWTAKIMALKFFGSGGGYIS